MDSINRWGHGARYHDADQGKTTLLNVAISCLAEKGFKSTTMQDVAEAAHVSRRTVYRYFSGKNQMFREAICHSQEMAFKVMHEAAMPHGEDFFRYLEEAIVAGVEFYLAIDLDASAAVGENRRVMRSFMEQEWLVDKWMHLLRVPYGRHLALNPHEKKNGMLEKYAELGSLIVTGHCRLRSNERTVRESVRNMMDLARNVEMRKAY